MKVLITGKNGQLGKELVAQATQSGWEVHAYGREELDITNHEQMLQHLQAIAPDMLINTSAYNLVQEAEKNSANAFAINTTAVKNLSSLCQEKNIHFVTYSTDYVFDGMKGSPYNESDTPNPLQMYGLSKYAGEIAARNYNTQATIIRTCGVYGGKAGSRVKKNFVLNILQAAKEKDELSVVDDQIVIPTYAVDLAKATIELLSKEARGGIYHLVNEGYCSWAQFAEEIITKEGWATRVIHTKTDQTGTTVKRPQFSALANEKAKTLGITLPAWKDALARYLQSLT